MLIPAAVESYLATLRTTRRPTTVSRASQILRGFVSSFPDRRLNELQSSDVMSYVKALPHSNRTKANHHIRIVAMLRITGSPSKPNARDSLSPSHKLTMRAISPGSSRLATSDNSRTSKPC